VGRLSDAICSLITGRAGLAGRQISRGKWKSLRVGAKFPFSAYSVCQRGRQIFINQLSVLTLQREHNIKPSQYNKAWRYAIKFCSKPYVAMGIKLSPIFFWTAWIMNSWHTYQNDYFSFIIQKHMIEEQIV